MSPRFLLLTSAALLALAACHREAAEAPASAPASPPAVVQAPEPARPPAAAAQPAAPQVSADERRRALRAEKDGEAQVERAQDYEGASSAATALPSQGEDAPAPASRETPVPASPPPPPPGQPPG